MDSLSEADHAALSGAKETLRTAVRTRRAARSPVTAAAHDHARFELLTGFFGDSSTGLTVATYVSIPPEPGTLELIAWLHAHGVTVLLPVLDRRADGTPRRGPDWAAYAGPESLRAGFRGIPEPATPPLGARGLSAAHVVVCSALAGTATGKRLGMGGGWFDRALEHAAADAVLVALLNDDEILPDLPTQPWDRPVDVLATQTRLVSCSD